jgi:hypothetical protein
MRYKKLWVLLILIISLLTVGATQAAGTPTLPRWIIGNGGGALTNGSVTLNGTIGQWVVGSHTNNNLQLNHGFWFSTLSFAANNFVYLPSIIR